jgi:hypothetical protein
MHPFYFLIYTPWEITVGVIVEKYVRGGNGFTCIQSLKYKSVASGMSFVSLLMYVCMYVCMYALLEPEKLECIHITTYISESLSSIKWCLVSVKIPASKRGVLHTSPQNINFFFFENACDNFD